MKFHAFILIALLSSCSLVRRAESMVTEAKGILVEAKQTYASAKTDADADGDGKTDPSEWMQWLIGGGFASIIGGGSVVARSAIRNAKSDGRKDLIERRLESLERAS